jgi:hypothetical protein
LPGDTISKIADKSGFSVPIPTCPNKDIIGKNENIIKKLNGLIATSLKKKKKNFSLSFELVYKSGFKHELYKYR